MLHAKPKAQTQQVLFQDLKSKKSSTSFNPINTLFGNQQTVHLPNNLSIPLYRGHFVNFHHEAITINDNYSLSGIQDGFLYFVVNQKKMQFYFYSPLQDDLNYYYNTDNQKYKFPIRFKEQEIGHLDYITAVGFQQVDDVWTMAIASEFYIFLYTFTADLDNFQLLKQVFNVNGEIINQILFYQDNLIYGGSSGTLTCKSIDTAQNYTVQLKEKIKRQFNRIFKDLTPWSSQQGLIQLELQEEFNICYGLFEKLDKNENVEDTFITIYDIGLQGELFQEIITIKQSYLYNSNLEFKNVFDYHNLQFYHAFFERQYQTNKIVLIITTKDQLQLHLLFELQNRTINEINSFKQRSQNSNVTQQQYIKLKPEFQIIQIKNPYMKIDTTIPYGVCLDESRIQYKQKEMLTIQQSQVLKSVYKEEQLSLFHLDNYIIAQFLDMAHIQYLRNLEQQITKYNSYNQIQYSIYRDTSKEAIEKIELNCKSSKDIPNHENGNEMLKNKNGNDIPKNIYNIGKMTVNRVFNHFDINESQLYNLPEHYICIADNTVEFIVRMRPIDCFFTAIKVTHYDFIDQVDADFPLEKLVRAYGIEESCAQILQIIIQEEQNFYINVELQHQYQLDLQKAYQRIHYSENIQKFFDDNEKIPNWVTGQVYVRKGAIIKEKALKAYFALIKRSLINEDRNQKSKKVSSTTSLIWKILAPLTTKKFINEKVYNLECNKPIESYSIQQLQTVFKQIEKLIKLFENEPNYFQQLKSSRNDLQIEEQNQFQNYKNGFSKYIYETFEQSTRLDISRSTNYSDQSLAVTVNVDVEYNQMKVLYSFCKKIKQLLQFLIYFFGELQGIRNIINSYQNKPQLFELSIKSVLCGDNVGNLTLKQLMIHIIKSDKTKFREAAQYMNHHFPDFFTIADFKISLVQNLFDEILTFSAQKNLIKLNPNEQINEKIKRILKLSKAPQITIDKVLDKREIFLYYKDLQPELQDQLLEALKLIEEVAILIEHSYLTQCFKNYMYPFATFKFYVQYLAQKCQQQEKDQSSDEYCNCIMDLIDQFNSLIKYYLNPPKGLTKAQTKEILIESLQILNQFQLIKPTEAIANSILKHQLKEFIQYIDYNQEMDLQCSNDLEKLQMQKKQFIAKASKGNSEVYPQLIQILLKLAQFSLTQCPEMNLEDIQIKLPIKKRLRYVNKAQEFIRTFQKNAQGIDINEIEKQAKNLSKQLFLQDIMYDYIVSNEGENQSYHTEKRKTLIEILDIKMILQFFEDNNIYFGQLLCLDYMESSQGIELPKEKIEQLWINYIYSSYEESNEWPTDVLKRQMKLLFENIINNQKYIQLQKMTETIELINTKICQDLQVTQLTTWLFFEILLSHDIREIDLVRIYLAHYKDHVQILNNPIYQKLQIEQIHTYKLQLIQQILILLEALKKLKSDQEQTSSLIRQFRNAFENDYRNLMDDELYDGKVIEQIKMRVDSL
ncbi:unnamed protein product [Paramecium octaurelia]|uniref:Uncharacterized protein n=1 Tax=Paramecium octaurelia TaxID=43137 RepID=A0A8S1VCE5_PAROT|nr:unnamed protein product [Paramecium octaurelia]